MSFSTLANNQMVSFTDAQSSGFTLKSGQTNPGTNQCITKSEALEKYNLDANAMNSYVFNQLVPTSVWLSGITGVALQIVKDENLNWSNICSASWTNPVTKYTISGLSIGQKIYNDVGCTVLWDQLEEYIHTDGYSFKVLDSGIYKKIGLDLRDHGLVQYIENCPTADTTPPTPPNFVSANNYSATTINLFWSGATDNVAVTSYRVYRNGNYIGDTTATSYYDYNVLDGTWYYQIEALDAAGNVSIISIESNYVNVGGGNQIQ